MKRTQYSLEYNAQAVIEVLREEEIENEIAAKYDCVLSTQNPFWGCGQTTDLTAAIWRKRKQLG